ncbi:MAG: hypothetical protein K0S78_5659, partial [Thermomicrobiales bacterium]|nr:hypothetical protein [Thermomicrobiales bacterium]
DAAGMNPEVTWTHRDLVVILGTKRKGEAYDPAD